MGVGVDWGETGVIGRWGGKVGGEKELGGGGEDRSDR